MKKILIFIFFCLHLCSLEGYYVNDFFAQDVVITERELRRGYTGFQLPAYDVRVHRPKRKIDEFITLSNFPMELKANYEFTIAFNCKKKSLIIIFVDGYIDEDNLFRNSTNPFLKYDPKIISKFKTTCFPNYEDYATKQQGHLHFPRKYTQRPSIIMPEVSSLNNIQIKAMLIDYDFWLIVQKQRKDIGPRHLYHLLFERANVKLKSSLKIPEPSKRGNPDKCFSWQYKILDKQFKENNLQSLHDEECISVINYPIIMAEEPYGVVKIFPPYRNPKWDEAAKLKKIRLTFTSTFYLMSWCKTNEMCSLVQHISDNDNLENPVVLINKLGQIQVQMKALNNKTFAHITPFSVPIRKWVKFELKQANTQINITINYGENFKKQKTFSALFGSSLKFVYDDGYLIVGGSLFCKNVDGIISQAKICRNKIVSSENTILPKMRLWKSLATNFQRENTMKKIVKKSYNLHHNRNNQLLGTSKPYFLEVISGKYSKNQKLDGVCELKQPPTSIDPRFSKLDEIIKELPGNLSSKSLEDRTTETLMNAFLHSLEEMNHFKEFEKHLGLLKQAALLGHPLAHYYLYVVYKNGVGLTRNMNKARYHLLSGARLNDRLCIKTLGYHHFMGINGFPQSDDYSIYYFLNSAHKTQKDLLEHSEKMTSVNTVRLTDETQMKAQLDKDEDLFEWLKLQATKGVHSAQRNMGRLLYWGQQGLQRNLQEAFKYYEKAASTGDPEALYDYGVVLVKGHGTEENVEKGIGLLKLAAEKNSPGAFNTLGWYYSVKKVNLTKAVEYFEKSDQLGSPDAAYNLGHLFHTGKHPEGRNLKKSFLKYYRAATRGHVESCLQVAYFYSIGIKDFLPANTYIALQWAKFLSDKNPVMGEIIRQALQAFRKHQWAKSLFLYMSVAETGFEVASFNTAFLCEENKEFIEDAFETECVWRFWNESANSLRPHPHALNKMGDYYYYGHGNETSLLKALSFYGKAAAWNHSHAIFNVASLLERHKREISDENVEELALPVINSTNREDLILQLYSLCSGNMKEASSVPCLMALSRLRLQILWRETPNIAKVIALIVIILTTILMIYLHHKRKRDIARQQALDSEIEDPESSTRLSGIENQPSLSNNTSTSYEEVVEN